MIPDFYILWLYPVAFCWKLRRENSGPPVLGPAIQLVLFQIPHTDGRWWCHETLNHDASAHLSTTVPNVWVSMGSVVMAFLSLSQPGEHFANRAKLFASHHTHRLSFLVTTFYCQVPAYFRIVPILFMARLPLFHFDRNLRSLSSA